MSICKNINTFSIIIAIYTILIISYKPLAYSDDVDKDSSIGRQFHYETSMTLGGVLLGLFRMKPKKPPQYKEYKDVEVIKLPKSTYRGVTVEEAIEKRRSVRDYSKKPIAMQQLSQLLFSAQGITGETFGQALRTSPSAGALYPFEVYVIVNNVESLRQGIYHYVVLEHTLELVKSGNFAKDITSAGLEQDMLGDAAITIVLSAIFDRACHKYGERGFRYVYMEAGHISQNIYLQAVSLGLGSVSVGAFLDKGVNKLIGVDGQNEAVIYLHAVGTL